MKRSLVVLLMLAGGTLAAQARLKFSDPKKNFGFVKKGEKVELLYEFTNGGNQPLIISEAKTECSCTSVTWPKEPIAPGQKGMLKVLFDTAPAYDRQDRTVEVISNDPASPARIRFKGVVLKN